MDYGKLITELRSLFGRREKRNAAILLFLMSLTAALEVFGVGAIPAFVAVLASPSRLQKAPLPHVLHQWLLTGTDAERTLRVAGALTVFFLVKNILVGLFTDLQARFVANRQVDLAQRLLDRYLAAPYTFHLQRNSAVLINNVMWESVRVVNDVMLPALRIAMEMLVLLGVMTLLFVIEPIASGGAVILIGGMAFLFLRGIRANAHVLGTKEHEGRVLMISTLQEALGGLKHIRIFGVEQYFAREFRQHSVTVGQLVRRKTTLLELPRLVLETAAVISMLLVAAFLLYQGRPMDSIVPTLALLAVGAVRLLPSANRILGSVLALKWGAQATLAIGADFRTLDGLARELPETGRTMPRLRNELRFEHVSFRYPETEEAAVVDLSVSIAKGRSVGIVGPSGAGKTTVVDLILGLLVPTEGRILIDGVDMRDDIRGWQHQVGYVPQEIYLLDNTITHNVAFGIADEQIDHDAVARALRAAHLTEFVEGLPDGLQTMVGERGVRLSGGQRQRLGIARALYHDPAILVFDEATSALDTVTEESVAAEISRLGKERTVIIVAHRLSTVRECDELLYLRGGALEARGSYSALMLESEGFRAMISSAERAQGTTTDAVTADPVPVASNA